MSLCLTPVRVHLKSLTAHPTLWDAPSSSDPGCCRLAPEGEICVDPSLGVCLRLNRIPPSPPALRVEAIQRFLTGVERAFLGWGQGGMVFSISGAGVKKEDCPWMLSQGGINTFGFSILCLPHVRPPNGPFVMHSVSTGVTPCITNCSKF